MRSLARPIIFMNNLTAIIPYRDGEATLTALLDSLPPDLPVIVVDDRSATPPRYIGRARQVRFVSMKSRGYFSGAVNAGLAGCATDMLVLNQDVAFTGDGWQALIEDNRAEYALIGDGVMNHPAWPKGYIQGTFMFIRRDVINRIGLLNERDYPLWGATAEYQTRACRAGFRALPVSAVPDFEHARGKEPFGSAIRATLASEPDSRRLLIRTPPAISVIVTCHNYGRYLTALINSLLGGPTDLGEAAPQTFQSFEIIIVNDASTDETHAISSALADDWKGVHYIRNKHRAGTAEAINIGVRAAYGKYITHICADDMMESGRLEYLYRTAEKNPGKVIYDDLNWFKKGEIFFRQILPEYDFEALIDQNKIHTGIFYEREIWKAVGGYPAVMANGREDWAMNVRLGRAGYCGLHVNQAGYLYRREGQNRTTRNVGVDWHRFFTEKMRALFPDIYAGERPAMCCGRPTQKKLNGNGAMAGRMMTMATDESVPAGMERIEYLGGNDGSQEWQGVVSRRRYLFNANKRRFAFVDTRDLETGDTRKKGLLELYEGGRPVFRRAPSEKKETTPVTPVAAPVAALAPVAEPVALDADEPLPEGVGATPQIAVSKPRAVSKPASKSTRKKKDA